MTENAPAQTQTAPRRASRWGLYLPFMVFGLICLAWSGYWMLARTIVINGIEIAIAEAAARGDRWSCADRRVGGYPFRIEIRCAGVQLRREANAGVVALDAGPMVAIGQPQTPGHVIIQAEGPMQARFADGARAEMSWEGLEASRRERQGEMERFSLQARRPTLTIRQGEAAPVTLSAQALEAHVRRNPNLPAQDKAADLSVRVTQLASAHLDALFGDANRSDVEAQLTVGRVDLLGRGLTPAAAEQWRTQSGKVDVTRLALAKGIKKVEAKGELGLDEQRRIAGRIEPAIANVDQFGGIRLRGGAMDLMSAMAGRGGAGAAAEGLRPLPAIELRQGRVAFGPFAIPGVRLDPLY